jgi:hypothetical protein
MSKQAVLARVQDLGAELVEAFTPDVAGTLIAPPGQVWIATGEHEIEYDLPKTTNQVTEHAAWAILLGWVSAGTEECTIGSCGECAA